MKKDIYLEVAYNFTSIICPNNHLKLSIKNKKQTTKGSSVVHQGDYFGDLKTK